MECSCELKLEEKDPGGFQQPPARNRGGDIIRIYVRLVKCPLCEAAPDLLEACKRTLLEIQRDRELTIGCEEDLKAAIEKAGG